MKSRALLRLMLRVSGLALRPRRGTSKVSGHSLDLQRRRWCSPWQSLTYCTAALFVKALLIRLSLKRLSLRLRPSVQRTDTNLRAESKWEYNKHALERLDEYKYDYGLTGASDGATSHRTSLVNFLGIVCCIVVLLEVVDCTGSMAAGGTKDGTFIANEMFTQCDKIGAKFVFLTIFDGASNMQSPTMPLVLC